MRTLRKELLTLEGHLKAGRISKADYKLAVRERQGRVINTRGRLLPKREYVGTEVNRELAPSASNAVQGGYSRSVKLAKVVRAPEVILRDMQVKYDRARVAMGLGSKLVKVVKAAGSSGE